MEEIMLYTDDCGSDVEVCSTNKDTVSTDIERYIPNVTEEQRPIIGRIFSTMEEAIEFYRIYAESAGFEIRKGSHSYNKAGDIARKFLYCRKEGLRQNVDIDPFEVVNNKRRKVVPSNRNNCKAHVKLHYLRKRELWEVYDFEEAHNHEFVSKEDTYLLPSYRNVTYDHQVLMKNANNINIGCVNAHKLAKEFAGGYDDIGASKVDFKNFQRDLNVFIGDSDAQMVVDKFKKRMENVPNFFFEYLEDHDDMLQGLFLADETQRINFKAFGDIVSFDATYSYNK